jgi:hypothetical protein
VYYFDFDNIDFDDWTFVTYEDYHEGHSDCVSTGNIVANAKRIAYVYCDIDILGSSIAAIDSQLITILYCEVDIAAKCDIDSNSKLINYAQLELSGGAVVISNSLLKMIFKTSMSGHADINTDSIIKVFEECNIYSNTYIQSKSAIRFNTEGKINAAAFVGGDATLAITASTIIQVTGNVYANSMLCLKSGLADSQVDGFVFDDKFFFLTGTEFCYYDGTNPVALVSAIAYIPTVLTGCAPTGGGTVNEAYNLLRDSWKIFFSGTTSATVYQMNLTDLDSIDSVYVSGALVDPDDFTVDLTAGTVTFDTAPGEGTDNVLIQATKAGIKNASIINKCKFHCFYGGQNDTRVFFAGNPDYKNYRFQSGLMDVTYFPDDGDQNMPNSDEESVTGMGKVGSYLITMTENFRFWTDVTANDTTVVFSINPLNDEHGCTSWRTVKPAQDGLLCLSYDGVTWSVPSSLASRSQLGTRIISEAINYNRGTIPVSGLLSASRAELESAFAYIYKNKYILHVGSKCWVLDLDYSVLAQGIYCWYPYTGLYATITQLLKRQDGLLWAGDDAGKVYKSNESYNDAGVAIDAWWTSPIIFGDRTRYKKFLELSCSFGSEAEANHNLSVFTEEDMDEYIEVFEDSRAFDFDDIDFDDWSFGSNPYALPVVESLKITGWYIYWKWQNNQLDQGMTIFSQVLSYQIGKKVK